ncbi:DNA/RNA non-specific endonuclease [Lutibacter sp.]
MKSTNNISFKSIFFHKLLINGAFTLLFLVIGCNSSQSTLIEQPKINTNETPIKHFAYTVLYNEKAEQAVWVAYQIKSSELEPNFKRTNRFLEDTLVATGTATNEDYKKSGYDKGHLAPAADMTWNKQAMIESFYFSNISPQLPGFNRGIWKKLEVLVRNWTKKYDSLYVVTGPVIKNYEKSIGKNNVTVPSHFYKTILIYNDSIQQGIGFIFPHKKCDDELFNYAVSIDSVEAFTKLDFYHSLPDKKEAEIERSYNLNYWEY